jgi:Tol biopolymer transport system component
VFVRSAEKAAREVYIMEALFGTDLVCLSRHRADDWNPAFSPKGDQLAFVSDRDDLRPVELHERHSDIFLFSLTDSSLTRFSQGFGAKAAPCFTPDGESLVYVNNVSGTFDIFEQRLGTTQPVNLIAKAGPRGAPQASPNRKHVVYFEKRDNNLDLYLFDRDKGSVQRLTCDSGVDAFPAFSPDGNEIYFTSNRGGNYQIYAMDLRTPLAPTELAETLRRLLEPPKTAAQ